MTSNFKRPDVTMEKSMEEGDDQEYPEFRQPIDWTNPQTRERVERERRWEYEDGMSAGIVTIAEIRRATYHKRISRMFSEEKQLAVGDLHTLHSMGWNSRMFVADARNDNSELPIPEVADVRFSRENQEYYTARLEELRNKVLVKAQPNGMRIVVVENLMPPVLEILGTSLNLPPALFWKHVGHSWGTGSNSFVSSLALSAALSSHSSSGLAIPGSDKTASALEFVIPQPRLLQVKHPSAWTVPEWRNECLRRAARFRQCRQLMPIYDVPPGTIGARQDEVQCLAFEHVTVHVLRREDATTRVLVLFPMRCRAWTEGNISVAMHETAPGGPRTAVWVPGAHTRTTTAEMLRSATNNPEVAGWWTTFAQLVSAGADANDPRVVLESLWRGSLDLWSAHLLHVARAVELLSTPGSSGGTDETALQSQQQLRAVIVQDIAVLSEVLDSIKYAMDALPAPDVQYDTNTPPSHSDAHGLASSTEGLESDTRGKDTLMESSVDSDSAKSTLTDYTQITSNALPKLGGSSIPLKVAPVHEPGPPNQQSRPTQDTRRFRLEQLHTRFAHVQTQLERHKPQIQHHIDIIIIKQQVRLQETQLEESRKAIQQADTIKRLTILAFVYIPIQTAASVFGMNVSELKPEPSVWTFVVTMAVLLIVTIAAAAWHRVYPVVFRATQNIVLLSGSVITAVMRVVGIEVRIKTFAGFRSSEKPVMPESEPSWLI